MPVWSFRSANTRPPWRRISITRPATRTVRHPPRRASSSNSLAHLGERVVAVEACTAGPVAVPAGAPASRAAARARARRSRAVLRPGPSIAGHPAFRRRIGQAAARGGPPRDDPGPGEEGSQAPRRRRDGRLQPHHARHRERRRRRHLRHDRHRRRPVRRARRGHLVPPRRHRRRPHGDLLRGARGDDPDRRLDLLLRLRGLRRLPGLVHRLGPAARVPVRGLDGRRRLGRLRGQPARHARHPRPARPRQRRRSASDSGIVNLPAIIVVAGDDRAARGRHAPVGAASTTRSSCSRSWCCCCSWPSARSPSTASNWTPVRARERRRLRRLRRLGDHPRRRASSSSPTSASTPSRPRRARRATRSARCRSACSATVLISTVLYVAIGLVLTGIVPYEKLNVADPLSEAVETEGPGADWLDEALGVVGAVVGLFSTVLVTFYGQTRILMRMSADGMLPPAVQPRQRALQDAGLHHDPLRRRRRVGRRAAADRRARRARLDRDAARLHARLRGRAGPAPHAPATSSGRSGSRTCTWSPASAC